MWRDYPFSQINKTTERAVGVGVGGDRERGWGGGQKLKRGGRQCRGNLHKIGGSANYGDSLKMGTGKTKRFSNFLRYDG